MLRGSQKEQVRLSFSIPSVCASQIECGEIDAGLVPVAEIARQGLEIVPGVGITCLGAVRSILLFSKVPWNEVRTLAADLGSRTSVQLARVILRERFGVNPIITERAPVLDLMLADADAALIIGDPALRTNPETLPLNWLDLGAEWLKLTSLPMVFAAWAGKPGLATQALAEITSASYAFGRERLQEIVDEQHRQRGVSRALANEYLSRYIRFEIGRKELAGLESFLRLAGLTHDYSTTSA
jgi:chorismate dehydratase